MNTTNGHQKFCSKVLLFGEYLVVKGARAIAIPYHHFSGELQFSDQKVIDTTYSLREFGDFLAHSKILSKAINIKGLVHDIEKGLYFASNIPSGHGVGSSGALCASIFSTYTTADKDELEDLSYLKDILSLMESFFHGISSGLDPLVSFIQKPIEIRNRNDFTAIDPRNFELLKNFFIVDTGITRKTAPLVHTFLNLCEGPEFSKPLEEMLEANSKLVEAFLNNDLETLKTNLYQLSYLQYIWFEQMIPQNFRKFWFDALESKKYLVKLCGAGGGGFLLVYTEELQTIAPMKYLPLVESF